MELQIPGGSAPREACWGLWFRRPETARGSGRTPTHLPGWVRSGLAGSGLAGVGRSALVPVRRRGRAPRSAGSSRSEGGAAASARAALYPGEEAPRRRPVTPGPAGPSGLPPRHSLAPLHRARSRDRPAADRHRAPQRVSEPSELATSASPDRTTTSVRQARPRASEWPAPVAGIESSNSNRVPYPPLSSPFYVYRLWSLSVTPLAVLTRPSPALIGHGLSRSAPEGVDPLTREARANLVRRVGVAGAAVCGRRWLPIGGPGSDVQLPPGAGIVAGRLHLHPPSPWGEEAACAFSCGRCFGPLPFAPKD